MKTFGGKKKHSHTYKNYPRKEAKKTTTAAAVEEEKENNGKLKSTNKSMSYIRCLPQRFYPIFTFLPV